MLQFAVHFTKQAIDEKISEKAANKMPTTIAPKTLVAAKVTPKRTTDASNVTRTPTINAVRLAQIQPLLRELHPKSSFAKSRSSTPKAMPKVTQRNTEGTVITAVKRRTPAIIPMMSEAVMPRPRQSNLPVHLQLQFIIFSPLSIL